MDKQDLSVIIPHESEVFLHEFSEFFSLFSILYIQCLFAVKGLDEKIDASQIEEHAEVLAKIAFSNDALMSTEKILEVQRLGMRVSDVDITVGKISYESPLEIVLTGCLPALILAAIVSGGKIKSPVLEVELRPLGKGLERLQELFTRLDKSPGKVKETNLNQTDTDLEYLDIPAFLRKCGD